VLDELHQSTVTGRTATLIDVGFDFAGASLVALRKFNYI
jgi:VanZ family protein